MSLTREQALVTVVVKGRGLTAAPETIREALVPYRDARIVTITRKTDWFGTFSHYTSLLVVIDYEPTEADSQQR